MSDTWDWHAGGGKSLLAVFTDDGQEAGVRALKAPALLMVVYFAIYYGYMLTQVLGKILAATRLRRERKAAAMAVADNDPSGKAKAKYNSKISWRDIASAREFRRGERSFLNMLEQMPPFLVSFWLCALLVDLDRALLTGAAYCVGRAFYYTLHPYHLVLVGLVTVPNYAEIAYMFMLVAHWAIY